MKERSSEPDEAWRFDHAPHGTCADTCDSYGTCHCGCSTPPKRATVNDRSRSQARGEPFVFAQGHHVRLFHPRCAPYSRHGIDIDRIRPMLFWLRERLGTMDKVAVRLRLPRSTVRGYAYKQRLKKVPPDAARVIVAEVLRLRDDDRRRQPWDRSA